jgi:hypothetical protein
MLDFWEFFAFFNGLWELFKKWLLNLV